MKSHTLIATLAVLVAGAVAGPTTVASGYREAAQNQHAPSNVASGTGSWTVYHHDNAHTGFDSTAPNAITATAGWVSPTLDGQSYTEPLVYNGLVYVATLNNTVYALNQVTGAVVWSKHLGAPQTSGWGCGNINPTGILGTGVIDATASRVYFAAFLTNAVASLRAYYLFGLDLATGSIQLQTQVKPTGFDWTIQQERGALAISKDGTHVYVPFGGRAGDCGAYNGWVTGVPTNGTTTLEVYKTPSHASGVWAAGGVVVDDTTGNVFFATGNAIPCGGAVNSDSVIRTSGTLGSATFFQPLDWSAHWCNPDSDLGSASPVLISPNLMFTAGKYGQGFLLDPTSLGGTNGQLFPAGSPYVGADVCGGTHSDATFGSFAYAAPYVYLECDGGGLVALQVNTGTPSFSLCGATCAAPSWNSGGSTTFGPPIVAGGAVWVVDIGGTGLYGYAAGTGAQIFRSSSFGVNHFSTPSEAGGQIFVSAGNVVRSFDMRFGCTSIAVTASPPSPQMVGNPITITGAASGCPNSAPSYQFWILNPGSSTWLMARDYNTSASFSWSTAGKPAGTYRFSVWAKDAASSGAFTNSLGSYDAFNAGQFFKLTSTPCSSVSVSASPPVHSAVGTAVTITGVATGCPNPRYQFWILNPGSSTWQMAHDYSTGASFNWVTAGKPVGTYRFSVWVRDATSTGVFTNSLGSYDGFNASQFYTLDPDCAAVGVSASPSPPDMVGTQVTITGSATGCLNANPLYQFWILAPGARAWALAKDYSTSATFNWSTAGKAAGTYRFSVWVHDSSSAGAFTNSLGSYDAFNAGQFFTLTPGCSAVSVSASPSSPRAAGTPVVITSAASGCLNANPLYQFWILNPGSSTWRLARDYTTSATYNWITTGKAAGTYRFSVWVHDASNTGVFVNSLGRYDAFNAGQFFRLS
jgi:outer membrane protein assembly factor BamB